MPRKPVPISQENPNRVEDHNADAARNENISVDGNRHEEEAFLHDFTRDLDSLQVPPPLPPVQSFDGTGPRLLITRVVNENFKSYYGRNVLGPFHKNFTSIVGPNGSGKSNVIDSLLFVFGYRAQRIRSKNVSVLIHSSEQHPNVDYCSVEVHFVKIVDEDSGKFTEVPNSAFVIKRTAYRDNSSFYYLNKTRVQFKEIGALLRQHGIDIVHNRFLILQGEVEQISLMKPKGQNEGEEGMLEYLEDIIGSSRLKPPIVTLHKRMEELVEMRNDKTQRANAVEEEKAELEGPKDEAVAFLELENSITRKKSLLYQIYLLEAAQSCSKLAGQLEELKLSFEEDDRKVQDVKEEINAKQIYYDKLKKNHDKLQAETDARSAAFRKLEQEDVKLREDLKHYKAKANKLEAARETETKKLQEFRSQPEKREKELLELQQKCADIETKKTELQTRADDGLKRIRVETKAAQDEKRLLEEQLLARQKIVADAREKLELTKSELELCLSAQTREKTKLDQLKNNMTTMAQSLEECRRKIEETEKAIPEMEDNNRQIDRRLKELIAEENTLNVQIREKSSRFGIANAALQGSSNRSRVLEALFAQQRKGSLKGIFGRLGDLGSIDQKFDVAISTACGALDNIVVDSIDTAQKCVDFLTHNNVGMGTFIALDKMAHLEDKMKLPFRAPENVPRLFDLITVEDRRLLPAFYYALRDTLVASDLDQATRVSFQGGSPTYRVVTLGGEIIDISGTMSGGGTRQCRGRMGRSIGSTPGSDDMTPEQLSNLEGELKALRAEAEKKRTERMQLEEDKDKLVPSLQNKKLDLNTWKMDVKGYIERRQILGRNIETQERILASTVPDEAEKKNLKEKIGIYQIEYDKVASVSAGILEEVKKIDKVILSITDKLVGSVQREVKECGRQIAETEKAIASVKLAARTAVRNIKNTEEKLARIEEETENLKADFERVNKRMTALEKEGLDVMMLRNQATDELEVGAAELKNAKAAVTALEEQLQSLESELIDQRNRVEQAKQTLKTFQQKRIHWEMEVKKLQLHDIRQMCGLPPAPEPKREQPEEREDGQNEEEEEVGPLRDYATEILEGFKTETVLLQLTMLEDSLRTMKPNLDALEEYRRKEQKHQTLLRQVDGIVVMKDKFRNRYEELRKQRLNEFMDGFGIISSKLKEMYQMITLGGDADLELVDTMDPFTEGIAFSVRPPKKSWKQIANLSGGEKTLSSLSLVFALHHYKPTPLYVMDEIDAALDFKNVSIVANYIKDRTKNAQFVIISLRNHMFELADRLIGIYKTKNCTKSAVLNPASIRARSSMQSSSIPSSNSNDLRNVLRDRSIAAEANAALPNVSIASDPVPTITDRLKLTPLRVSQD